MRLAIVEEQKKGSMFVERRPVVEESQRKEEGFVVAEIERDNRSKEKVVEEERQRVVVDSQLRECRVDQVEEQKERQEVEAFSKGKVAEKEEERFVAKKVEVHRIDLRRDFVVVVVERESACKERIEVRHVERVERLIVAVCRVIVFSVHR